MRFHGSGFQELFNVRADRDRESLHVVDRNVAFAALNGTDVGAVQPGFFSQIFLEIPNVSRLRLRF